MEKVALCFIINYHHILNKEHLWREWIEPNKDIINVYFFYKDLKQIKSKWINNHTIPQNYICNTSYYHVVPAYLSILNFALKHDTCNKWFCYLTDSCCPIISPSKFRELFLKHKDKSIMAHSKSYWNIDLHRRANLKRLPYKYHLANDPWFVLTRENAIDIMKYIIHQENMCNVICSGGLANESLFAIIFTYYNKIENVINKPTHMTDWSRMSSSTSPHIFTEGDERDIQFIEKNLKENEFVMFIRKIHPMFPDSILKKYIYSNEEKNNTIQKKNHYSSNSNVFVNIKRAFFINIGIIYGFALIYAFYLFHLTPPSITAR
jgi:hypothetical protein